LRFLITTEIVLYSTKITIQAKPAIAQIAKESCGSLVKVLIVASYVVEFGINGS
jgi:hypothetical protein